jgi:hypothetical protein
VQEADLPEQKVDASETQGEIYKSAQTTSAQIDVLADSTSNWQTQTANAYRRAGKSAFVRALDNGASKTAAVTAAKEAVQANYSRSQIQLIKSFEAQVEAAVTMSETAEGEQNLSVSDVIAKWNVDTESTDTNGPYTLETTKTNVTLANGTEYEHTALEFVMDGYDNFLVPVAPMQPDITGAAALPPDNLENASYEMILQQDGPDGYTTLFNEYESQANTVASNVESFANEAYDSWSTGDISKTDLVDPYMGARDFEPNGTQGETWTQQQLLSLGITPPKNFSSIERMTVRDESSGMVYNGTLMSGGTPQGGGFEVGQTYNAETVPGIQYVVSRTAKTQLNGNFTLVNATDMDGQPVQSVNYTQPNLNTTNLEEFKEAMDEYRKFREEIETREEKMRNESSGPTIPNPFSGLSRMQSILAIVAVAGAALLILRN